MRYIDMDNPSLLSTCMKEVRYSRKTMLLDRWALSRTYEREFNEKDEGLLPVYTGSPTVGLRNSFGWQLQGYIEDEQGRLRLQTEEEHRFCMGCHSAVGVTVDQTFTLARKVPGADGWGHQSLAGIPDVPQLGHDQPEILTYFERVTGGTVNVHAIIENGDTALKQTERVYTDGTLWLDWRGYQTSQ